VVEGKAGWIFPSCGGCGWSLVWCCRYEPTEGKGEEARKQAAMSKKKADGCKTPRQKLLYTEKERE
jgi:hypothetical protein